MTEKIVNRLEYFKYRGSPIKKMKYKNNSDVSERLTKIKKEKDYEYYTCDYCDEEIKIEKDVNKRTGGICIIPYTVTKRIAIELALHDKCLNPVLREFEEVFR